MTKGIGMRLIASAFLVAALVIPLAASAADAPVRHDGADDWLLRQLSLFSLLLFGAPGDFPTTALGKLPVHPVFVTATAQPR